MNTANCPPETDEAGYLAYPSPERAWIMKSSIER